MNETTTETKSSDNKVQNQDIQKSEAPAHNSYLIPGAIIAAGIFIAFAVVMTGELGASKNRAVSQRIIQPEVAPITDADHVRGAEGAGDPRDADVFLIEYSDYQCPYCARFHTTVMNALKKYDGRVAWVYRHFPLESIHSMARPTAVASECVAELAGEDAFWKFTDLVFESKTELNAAWLSSTAVSIGVEKGAYEECIASGRYDQLISDQSKNAQEMNGQGTPHNILLTKDGGMIPFSGAQPEEQVSIFIERALKTL